MKDNKNPFVYPEEGDTPLHLIHPPRTTQSSSSTTSSNHHHHHQPSSEEEHHVKEQTVYSALFSSSSSSGDDNTINPTTTSSSIVMGDSGGGGSSNINTIGRSPDVLIQTKFEQERKLISKLYSELDVKKQGYITVGDLEMALKKEGLDSKNNPELKNLFKEIINIINNNGHNNIHSNIHNNNSGSENSDEYNKEVIIDFDAFYSIVGEDADNIISRALSGRLAIPDWSNFCSKIKEIFEQTKEIKEGEVATYIPQLAEVDPELYGLAICTVDGQRFSLGDCDVDFTIQSCSKVFTYCIVCEDIGADNVHQYVGFEPSGGSFNAFTLDDENKPHNPMINAGAITVCSLVKPDLSPSKRFTYVSSKFSKFAGGSKIGFDNATFLSEKSTGDRNFALSYYMQENNVFPEESRLEDTLDLYFQICSILVNSNSLATMAATLANGGTCPLTNNRIVSNDTVKCALQLMLSCGMYDFSGNWSCTVGLPAKSGVAGAICIVIPSVMGMCLFSPRLDPRGNSVRGVEFCKRASDLFEWSLFDRLVPNPPSQVEEDEQKGNEITQPPTTTEEQGFSKRKRNSFHSHSKEINYLKKQKND